VRVSTKTSTINPSGSPKLTEVPPEADQTPAERFESLATKLVRVPKKEVDEQSRRRKQR
jgi:hypothetical protein